MDATIGLLIFRGLGDLTKTELGLARIPFSVVGRFPLRGHELLILSVPRPSLRRLGSLRTVEDVFAISVVGAPMQRAEDLSALGGFWTAARFLDGLAIKNEVFGKPKIRKAHTCAVFVKADQDRAIHRKEIAGEIEKTVKGLRNWKIADPGEAEVWGFFSRETVTIGVRLTDGAFRARTGLFRERPGALRPTLAAAMAIACQVPPGGRIVDPMCGLGTILFECGIREPTASLAGFDRDAEAVELARKNLRFRAEREIRLAEGDAGNLPLADGCVDRICCNLPFGKTYSSREANPALYRAISREWVRILKPEGSMVLLTSDLAAFRGSFGALPALRCETLARIDVLGVWADLMRVSRGP